MVTSHGTVSEKLGAVSTQLPPLQGFAAMYGGCAQQAAAPGDAQALCQQLLHLVLSVRVPAGSTAGVLVQGTGALGGSMAAGMQKPGGGSSGCRAAAVAAHSVWSLQAHAASRRQVVPRSQPALTFADQRLPVLFICLWIAGS